MKYIFCRLLVYSNTSKQITKIVNGRYMSFDNIEQCFLVKNESEIISERLGGHLLVLVSLSNNNFGMVDHDPEMTILIAVKTLKSFIKTHLK